MKKQNCRRLLGTATLLMSLGLVSIPARAQTRVWQIGTFNHSSIELKHNLHFESPGFRVVYTVGKSTASDWPAYQPGSKVPEYEGRTFPYAIHFRLARRPAGNYLLTIGLILQQPRYPNLVVGINGKKGLFYVHREVSNYPDDGGFDSPIYGEARLNITLPGSFLHAGPNTLTLTAMDDPNSAGGSSYWNYDAIRLSEESASALPAKVSASVDPTVFYVQKGGELYEQTEVTATLPRKVRKGSLTFSVGKERFHAVLSDGNDFGQQRFRFDVPAIATAEEAQLRVRVNGRTYRFEQRFTPARKWTVDLVPHNHLDVGYTDFQAKVAEVHSRNMDTLLGYMPGHPAMRFSLDGSWIVQHFQATRTAAAQKKFFNLVRAGRIAVPAQYANLLTGYASLEELIRSTDYTQFLHRTQGIPFDYANITDVPSYTWSYPSVLHALGIKYFAAAANSDRAPILLYGHWNTKSPFWWQGPDGAKVLMAYTRQYSQFWFTCRMPPTMGDCREGIPTFLQQFESPDYKPDTVLMFGTQFENTDIELGEVGFVKKWNARYAYPKFVITTFPDYFRYIDQHYGPELPTVTGDGGPYWEDGVGSDAKYTAIDRDDQQRALSGEKLSTIATFLSPDLAAPRRQIERMWQDMILYAEHTYGAWDSIYRPNSEQARRQLAVKNQFVKDSRTAVNSLVERSLSQVGDAIRVPSGTLMVFNTLSWQRSGLVSLDIDDGSAIVEYPGATPVPVEVMRKGNGYERVRFLARNVPAMGFRCYRLVPWKKGFPAAVLEKPEPTGVMENAYYRIEVDPATGAVKSIFDKQLNRELLDSSSPYEMDQYLYVSGGGNGPSPIVSLQKEVPPDKLTVHPSSDGHIVGWRKTPFGQELTVESRDDETPSIRTDILLFNGEKKIEFVNQIDKKAVRDKEGVYFAFPFAVRKPEFRYEIQNGWVNPERDMLKGASLEWFSVRHWLTVSNTDESVALVPLDAPLVSLGDINRGTWPEKFEPKSASVFSYALNNYWHTNYRGEQGGKFTFRYVLTSGADLSATDLARLGRSAMTPLEAEEVSGRDKNDNPAQSLAPTATSFLQVSAPNVVVEDWKAANDGQGTILRLVEVGGRATTARLTFPLFHLEQAWLTNAAEENQSEISVSGSSLSVSLKPHQIVTLRIAASMKSGE